MGLTKEALRQLWENIESKLDERVEKVDGKGLSTNDFTTEEKNKLAGIADGANQTIVDDALSDTSTNPVQNKVVQQAIKALDEKTIAIDDSLSSTSTNPVQNKVITEALESKTNQNAFGGIKIDETTISAENISDLFTLLSGDNVTLELQADTKTITIKANDTTYELATVTTDGLLSAADKTKLDQVDIITAEDVEEMFDLSAPIEEVNEYGTTVIAKKEIAEEANDFGTTVIM